jgi:hypothetical protein
MKEESVPKKRIDWTRVRAAHPSVRPIYSPPAGKKTCPPTRGVEQNVATELGARSCLCLVVLFVKFCWVCQPLFRSPPIR